MAWMIAWALERPLNAENPRTKGGVRTPVRRPNAAAAAKPTMETAAFERQ